MVIKISERLRPYSHLPGTACLIPGSHYVAQIFPCLIRLHSLDQLGSFPVKEITLTIQGPLKDFTVQSDLEQGEIKVWGKSAEGFIYYRLASHSQGKGVSILVERVPLHGLCLRQHEKECVIYAKQAFDLSSLSPHIISPFLLQQVERLSLGNHKSQDWDLVRRRLELEEIFPAWHRLGQLLPTIENSAQQEGAPILLKACLDKIDQHKGGESVSLWQQLFLTGFSSLLVPRLKDEDHQGIIPASIDSNFCFSPLALLTEGTRLIRRLFIEKVDKDIHILSMLPPEFHCGRLMHVQLGNGVILDLEWTKKTIRCLSLFVPADQEFAFHFKKVQRYRLRKKKSKKEDFLKSGDLLHLEKNCYYFFDNFN